VTVEDNMELTNARQQVDELQLPEWIRSRKVEADVDQDGDSIVRVILGVDAEFEPSKFEGDVVNVEALVRQAVNAAGVDHWVIVSLNSGSGEV
jgi:hypothetical protein